MAGVDLRTVQVLGGWRTLAMVQRYSHLAPAHLREAVERLVPISSRVVVPETATEETAVKHERNLNGSGCAVIDVS